MGRHRANFRDAAGLALVPACYEFFEIVMEGAWEEFSPLRRVLAWAIATLVIGSAPLLLPAFFPGGSLSPKANQNPGPALLAWAAGFVAFYLALWLL